MILLGRFFNIHASAWQNKNSTSPWRGFLYIFWSKIFLSFSGTTRFVPSQVGLEPLYLGFLATCRSSIKYNPPGLTVGQSFSKVDQIWHWICPPSSIMTSKLLECGYKQLISPILQWCWNALLTCVLFHFGCVVRFHSYTNWYRICIGMKSFLPQLCSGWNFLRKLGTKCTGWRTWQQKPNRIESVLCLIFGRHLCTPKLLRPSAGGQYIRYIYQYIATGR